MNVEAESTISHVFKAFYRVPQFILSNLYHLTPPAGFSTNQFSYDNSVLGNKVTLFHEDDSYSPVECTVVTYYTTSTRIVCDAA